MASLARQPIDMEAEAAAVHSPRAGAILTFSGVVRGNSRGKDVRAIEYHAYEAMASRQLDRIEEEARGRWPELGIRIVHRFGLLAVGESSVFIAVASPHRAAGFEALRFAIEEIKRMAPIWKLEMFTDGTSEWVEGS